MNKKQRVLTVIALITFVIIGAFHYLQWPPIVLYYYDWVPLNVWKELTYQEAKKQDVGDIFFDLDFVARLKQQGGYTDSQGKWLAYGEDAASISFIPIPDDAKVWFLVKTGTRKQIWKPYFNVAGSYPAIVPDVRVPWFMLGVIYVGMFFLLADRKEKQGRKLDISRLDR